MLVQPVIIIVIFLFHKAFLDYYGENVSNNTDCNKYVAVQIKLSNYRIYLNQIIVGVENHITMHQ
jgi:hypothetical protein